MRVLIVLLLVCGAAEASAQESRLHADLRRQANDLKESCGSGFDPKSLAGCVYTLATDDPFHVAFGSLAPQNGTAFGLAFAEHSTPNRWRIGWNADGVIASGGSYRAGFYVKLVPVPPATGTGGIVVRRPGAAPPSPGTTGVTIREYPVWNVYAQTTSLETVPIVAHAVTFRERQTILGTNLVYPISGMAALRPLRLSIGGAVNGRFVRTASASNALTEDATFAQFEEDVRVRPSILGDRLQLDYVADFQQFVTPTTSVSSFHRWTVDLRHTISLYRTVTSTGPNATHGPDDCGVAMGDRCPALSFSRNREGAIAVRILASQSLATSGGSVPFYFQPTLGGSDIDGQRMLSAYDDYQFRGTNLFVLQESVEHSIAGPMGVYILAEHATLRPDGAGFSTTNLRHSFGVGVTLRAGGFPLVNLTFAWGGGGHHIIGSIDPTLLGGSSRPSLY